jgi:glutamine amidotransferase-like uncharacterized protein
MSVSRKVFIYNGTGASSKSADDLEKFLRENDDIFAEKPDIALCDYTFNPEGLSCPTFVVPGGSTAIIGKFVRQFFDDSANQCLGGNYNYIGVCAGSMVGANSAEVFLAMLEFDKYALVRQAPSRYFGKYHRKSHCAGLVKADSIGSFYPLPQVRNSMKVLTPYRVTLNLDNQQQSSQLFVGSPGFDPNSIPADVDVVATYADRESYPFYFKDEVKIFKTLPAILRQKPSQGKGGRVLSGTHFEACVNDSKMLRFFKAPGKDSAELSQADIEKLEAEQEKTTVFVKDLFKTSLK